MVERGNHVCSAALGFDCRDPVRALRNAAASKSKNPR
jgi:hypothetical protein